MSIDQQQRTLVTRYSILLMLLTSVHHIYGAWVYNTPWRLHILVLSIPTLLLTWLLDRLLRKGTVNILAFAFYWVITLVASISLIGLYEGVYNHAFKNVVFFAGVKRETLLQLFPPPEYELPNDFWFELSGILQGVLAVLLMVPFAKLTASLKRGRGD